MQPGSPDWTLKQRGHEWADRDGEPGVQCRQQPCTTCHTFSVWVTVPRLWTMSMLKGKLGTGMLRVLYLQLCCKSASLTLF